MKKIILLNILQEDMLILFINDFLAVTDYILEEIVAALFKTERLKLRIDGIPEILIRDRIYIVNTGIIHQQCFGNLFEYLILFRHFYHLI